MKLLTLLKEPDGGRARLLRWSAAVAALVVFLLFLAFAAPGLAAGLLLPWFTAGLFGLLLTGATYWAAGLALARPPRAGAVLPLATGTAAERRLKALLCLSEKVSEPTDERAAIDLLLRLVVESGEALAASFVPLDDHGQPLAAVHFGDIPGPALETWVEYLASPTVRHRCGACHRQGELQSSCPLLQISLPRQGGAGPLGIYCLPLRWGEHEFGVLNLYLPQDRPPCHATQEFFRALVGEAALALESARLQRRALVETQQLKTLRQRMDLTGLLSGFLENIRLGMKADFAVLMTLASEHNPAPITLSIGELPSVARAPVEGMLKGVMSSGEPLLLGDMGGQTSAAGLRSVVAAPLLMETGTLLGAILVGSVRSPVFGQLQLVQLQSEAGQVALVVHNLHQLAELEFNTIMAERTRLAREIHDGLAQTLGFLKLQTAQMQNYLSQGELEHLEEGLRTTHKVLSEAYLETRQAIDGLRLKPSDEGLATWLEQAAVEFEEVGGVRVELVDAHDTDTLAPEIQAQLIRIVQEALSNIRKHAQATQVWISAQADGNELVLEVRDDGRGFAPEDIPGPSRYGLQGMRERTELLGADFQIISHLQAGTTVRVRLPFVFGEKI